MPKVVPEYKEHAKERILQIAQQVFSEKGYYETRMEDIAERLGVSKRTLYLYFTNKEELFRAICRAETQALKQILSSAMSNQEPALACKRFFDISTREPPSALTFEIIAAASRDPALRKIVRELFESEVDVVAHCLKEAKEKGVFPANLDAPLVARALIALYNGLMADIVVGLPKAETRRAWLESLDSLMGNQK